MIRKWRRVLPYMIYLAIGYLVAALSFRRTITVDIESGRVIDTCQLFPFSMVAEQRNRAFEVIFPLPSDSGKRELVSSQSFINIFGLERDFLGGLTVQAENKLAYSFLKKRLQPAERVDLSRQFFESIKRRGPSGAMDFVESMSDTSILGPESGQSHSR